MCVVPDLPRTPLGFFWSDAGVCFSRRLLSLPPRSLRSGTGSFAACGDDSGEPLGVSVISPLALAVRVGDTVPSLSSFSGLGDGAGGFLNSFGVSGCWDVGDADGGPFPAVSALAVPGAEALAALRALRAVGVWGTGCDTESASGGKSRLASKMTCDRIVCCTDGIGEFCTSLSRSSITPPKYRVSASSLRPRRGAPSASSSSSSFCRG
mmetsp:Transcript_6945/g.13223  ORF Transcript_6945/g.13223 Transcript_6945/m.13223 type:complete len:209 (-) Transcript_6945:17-643(-)